TTSRACWWGGCAAPPPGPGLVPNTRRCSPPARSRSGSRATERPSSMIYGLGAHAATTPDRTALVCGSQRLTYGEFERWVNRVANALAARGLGAGGRVALLL